MPPNNSQTKSVPVSVVRGHPPVELKGNYHDSDPNMSGILHISKNIFYKVLKLKDLQKVPFYDKKPTECFDLSVRFFFLLKNIFIVEAYIKHFFKSHEYQLFN